MPIMTPDWFAHAIAHRPQAHRIEVAGAQISCLEWGRGEGKPGLLLVHGMMASARWWAPIAPYFAPSHHVVALDLSGMGDSDHRDRYRQDLHAQEVAAVVRHFGLRHATILAHSFGGIPSCAALAADPLLAERLILVDSPVFSIGSPLKSDRANRPRTLRASRDEALTRFRLIPPGKTPMPDYVRYIAEHSLIEKAGGWDWKFDWRLSEAYDPAPPPPLDRVTVPSWVVYGDLSEVQSPQQARDLADAIAGPTCLIGLPEAHHHVMIEQPMAVIAAIRTIFAASAPG